MNAACAFESSDGTVCALANCTPIATIDNDNSHLILHISFSGSHDKYLHQLNIFGGFRFSEFCCSFSSCGAMGIEARAACSWTFNGSATSTRTHDKTLLFL